MFTFLSIAKISINFFIVSFLLNIWINYFNFSSNNKLFKIIEKINFPIINFFYQNLKKIKLLENITFFIVLFLSLLKVLIISFIEKNFYSKYFISYILLMISVPLKIIGEIIIWSLLIRLIFNWIDKENSKIKILFFQITEPFITFFKNFININNNCLSILFILILYLFNYFMLFFFPNFWSII
ncbi:MAG: hypothetical protein ACG0KC_01760 [Enterobacteriaceae bacterium]